jgi:hypothetical protein
MAIAGNDDEHARADQHCGLIRLLDPPATTFLFRWKLQAVDFWNQGCGGTFAPDRA